MNKRSTSSLEKNELQPEIMTQPNLRHSTYDGMSHAAMLGCGETYLGAFAIYLKGTVLQVGLLSTLPALIGALCQLLGAWSMERKVSRRMLIVAIASVQAILWGVLACIPYCWGISYFTVCMVILLATLYHCCAGFIGPIWNSLIGDLVPTNIRGVYFGIRNSRISTVTFLAVLISGGILSIGEGWGNSQAGFAVIFVLAGVARWVSVYFLSRHDDPPFCHSAKDKFSFYQFLKRSPKSNFARFVFFVGFMNFSVWFSAPYFAIYMLSELKFSYFEFTAVSAAAVFSQILTLRYWGQLSDRFGNKKILDICAIGITIPPFLWLFSDQVLVLILAQLFSGFIWAGYHLVTANFLFDAVSPPKRGRCVAFQGVISGFFILSGSLTGGYAANHLGAGIPFNSWFWVPQSVYLTIFLLSGCLRAITTLLFIPMFREVREVESIRHRDLIFRIAHIRAFAGVTLRPLSISTSDNHDNENGETDGGKRE